MRNNLTMAVAVLTAVLATTEVRAQTIVSRAIFDVDFSRGLIVEST